MRKNHPSLVGESLFNSWSALYGDKPERCFLFWKYIHIAVKKAQLEKDRCCSLRVVKAGSSPLYCLYFRQAYEESEHYLGKLLPCHPSVLFYFLASGLLSTFSLKEKFKESICVFTLCVFISIFFKK